MEEAARKIEAAVWSSEMDTYHIVRQRETKTKEGNERPEFDGGKLSLPRDESDQSNLLTKSSCCRPTSLRTEQLQLLCGQEIGVFFQLGVWFYFLSCSLDQTCWKQMGSDDGSR